MHARTWIGLGLLAVTALVVRRGERASEAAGAATAPPAAQRDAGERHAPEIVWSDSPAQPQLAASPPRSPAVRFREPAELAHSLGIELDDEPSSDAELNDPARAVTTASVGGIVRDVETGEPLPGVTVIATSPALDGTQAAITDENGQYRIVDLPPGDYSITYYYVDTTIEHPHIELVAGRARFDPLVLDPNDDTRIRNIPVPGRVFEEALGAAAGEQVDSYGTSFTGVTSIDNVWIIDGIDGSDGSDGATGVDDDSAHNEI